MKRGKRDNGFGIPGMDRLMDEGRWSQLEKRNASLAKDSNDSVNHQV